MNKIIFVLIFLVICPFLYAQKTDTAYIEPVQKPFTARIHLNDRDFRIIIKPTAVDTLQIAKIKYSPNLQYGTGMGLTYRNIALNLFFKLPMSEKRHDRYGNTEYIDMRVNLALRRMYGTAYVKRYDGFYMRNPMDVLTGYNRQQPNPQRSDLFLQSAGVEMYYNFKPRQYSFNASYKLTERQLKSVGTFLIFSEFNYTEFKADSGLVPFEKKLYFGKLNNLQGGKYPMASLLAGYTYCKVWNRVFINPSVFAGGSVMNKTLESGTDKINEIDYSYQVYFRLTGGYNGKRFFTGVFANSKNFLLREDEINFASSDLIINVFAGMRF